MLAGCSQLRLYSAHGHSSKLFTVRLQVKRTLVLQLIHLSLAPHELVELCHPIMCIAMARLCSNGHPIATGVACAALTAVLLHCQQGARVAALAC